MTHPNTKQWAALGLKIALGLLFIISGVSKLIGIDAFEVYLYSFGFFSLPTALVLARLVIAGEILLGIGLAANVFNQLTVTVACCLTLLFTCFLCYAALIGRTDSCHCFGSLITIDPTTSLIKNGVLMVLLLLVRRVTSWKWRPRWFVWLPVAVAPFVAVFCISVPDNWMFGPEEEILNYEKLEAAIGDGGELQAAHLDEGHKLVAFFTPGCPFCKMARQKLSTIADRYEVEEQAIVMVYPVKDSLHGIEPETFMGITYGQRPELVLLAEGKPVASFHYRNINEKRIGEFLKEF